VAGHSLDKKTAVEECPQLWEKVNLFSKSTGFLARVRDHFEKKVNHLEKRFKKLECHLEWEDVSLIMPQHLTARLPMNRCALRSSRTSARLNTAPPVRLNSTHRVQDRLPTCRSVTLSMISNAIKNTARIARLNTLSNVGTNQERLATLSPAKNVHQSTKYSEVSGTEYEEACHTELTGQCKNFPEC